MKRVCWSAAMVVLAACQPQGGNSGDYLNNNNPATAAGTGVVTGPAGTGGPPSTAGTFAMAGTGETMTPLPAAGIGGVAGMAGAAGTGVMAGTGGIGAAGTMAAGAGGAEAGMGGAGGAAGTGAAAGTGGGNTPGTVTITFTTITYGGEYAPFNYGAVWFESPSGTFIKTAKRWAGTIHAGDLVTWTQASGGWGSIFGGGNQADMMDAISMATLRTHQMHTVTWNMHDANGQLVPDGEYVAVLEVTEDRGRTPGPVVRIPFTKGPAAQMVPAADTKGFSGIMLNYAP